MIYESEEIERMVLDAVSNDFEEFEAIVRQIQGWTPPGKDVPGVDLIEKAIVNAVTKGDIEAFTLSSTTPHFVPSLVRPDMIKSLWFYVTPKGKERESETD